MFQVDKPTLTARLSDADKPDFNEFLKRYQTHFGVVFTTYREFLTHVSTNPILFAEQTPPDDVIPVNTITEQIKEFSDLNKLPNSMTPKEVVNAALTAGVLIPVELGEAVEEYAKRENIDDEKTPIDVCLQALTAEPKTVEIEKEIPAKVEENQLLLTFSKSQHKCLHDIHNNRAAALKEQESEAQTIEQTALGLMFNPATLGNWSRQYFTGLE